MTPLRRMPAGGRAALALATTLALYLQALAPLLAAVAAPRGPGVICSQGSLASLARPARGAPAGAPWDFAACPDCVNCPPAASVATPGGAGEPAHRPARWLRAAVPQPRAAHAAPPPMTRPGPSRAPPARL